MTKMNEIILEDWHYSCGEPGCCDDYGTTLTVNGEVITDDFEADETDVETLLKALNVPFTIEERWEDE
jgi:hypothetical protein